MLFRSIQVAGQNRAAAVRVADEQRTAMTCSHDSYRTSCEIHSREHDLSYWHAWYEKTGAGSAWTLSSSADAGGPLRRAGQISARGPFNSPEYELHFTSASLAHSSGGLSPRFRAPSLPPGDFDQAETRSVCSKNGVHVLRGRLISPSG